MPPELEIRPIVAADLPRLQVDLPRGGPAKHADRLARQANGEAVYLIAWQGDRAVGHALLKWEGSDDPYVASRLDGPCPDVEDLFVAEDIRERGVGTRLLAAVEELARVRGCTRIGLSVGVAPYNPARRLYERLGYRDAGFGEYLEQGAYPDANNEIRLWQEMCVYLIKDLRGASGSKFENRPV